MSFLDYPKLFYYLARPNVLFLRRTSMGMGDNLLLTMLPPLIRRHKPKVKIVVETPWPELFENNPHIDWVTDTHFKTTKRHLKPKYHIHESTTVSIYEQMTSYVGEPQPATPRLYFSPEEISRGQHPHGPGTIVTCPVGKATFTANRKEWGLEKFQALKDRLRDFNWVQIGSPEDPLLQGVTDARGLPVRQSAALVYNAKLFIGLEGGLMHLARAVDTPAAIVYGGFIRPEISGYSGQLQIHNAVHCSPCFHSHYPHTVCDTMTCMEAISPDRVFNRITEAGMLE